MKQEIKLNEICIYKGNYNQKEILVKVVSIREDSDGWTHKVLILDDSKSRYWIHPRNLISIGENSELINVLDSVGLF